ncbi:scavenger receptor class b member 1 [Plakobranchus ocellatus]|uniref:Scavenger receptor class b member 1 n=1 Tax=Plakobranchus ocellatus TaxID=259542 RepID=A0AAV3ZB31_9GAST|nr:scavenger receptor class b member 1 [Plakobranchus ocellatus]
MSRIRFFTKRRIALLAFITLACIFTLIARLFCDGFINYVMEDQIRKNMVLKNGTQAFQNWVKPPVPVAFKIYVFDVINPREIVADSAIPAVIEKGPYVYNMYLEKKDIKFHENNTAEYRQPQKFVFDREASVGPENDTFTNINIMFLIVATMIQHQPAIAQNAVDLLFEAQKDGAFVTRSVKDIWWGYNDPVLEEVAELVHRLHLNKTVPCEFGFYMDRNNTDDGLFNVYSGLNGDFSQLTEIDRWNGIRKLSVWNSDYANRIEGSSGSMQPFPVKKHSNLSIFDPNMLRSLNLVYQKASSVAGVDSLRFAVPFSDFASPKDNPNNAGFCTPDEDHCLPSGAINMKLSIWNSDYANRIEGSSGSMQPFPVKKHSNLSIFDPNMLRSLNLVYQKASSVAGVDSLRFAVPFSDFASPMDNPNNAGFCTPDEDHCLPSGAINMSVAAKSTPMILSLPHFVGGDPFYQRQVRGMSPSPEKHQPFYEYHPLTGISLRAGKRYQISMKISPFEHFRAFRNVRDAYLPVLWIDGESQMDDENLNIFRTKFQAVVNAMQYVKIGLVALTCLFAWLIVLLILYWSRKDQKVFESLVDSGRNPLVINEAVEEIHSTEEPLTLENSRGISNS